MSSGYSRGDLHHVYKEAQMVQFKIEVYPYGLGYVGIVSRSDRAESVGYLEGDHTIHIAHPDDPFPVYLREKSILRDFKKFCEKQEELSRKEKKIKLQGKEYAYHDGIVKFNKNVTP